jgi:hypothetical protein
MNAEITSAPPTCITVGTLTAILSGLADDAAVLLDWEDINGERVAVLADSITVEYGLHGVVSVTLKAR